MARRPPRLHPALLSGTEKLQGTRGLLSKLAERYAHKRTDAALVGDMAVSRTLEITTQSYGVWWYVRLAGRSSLVVKAAM